MLEFISSPAFAALSLFADFFDFRRFFQFITPPPC